MPSSPEDYERELEQARRENRALYQELADQDRRIDAVESSIVFRMLRRLGFYANQWKRARPAGYPRWLQQHRSQDPLGAFANDKTSVWFSVLSAAAFQGQSYKHWESCPSLEQARGEYVVLADDDAILEASALAHFAAFLGEHPCDIVYADEGYLDEQSNPVAPLFKPGWSPALFAECMYLGRLLVFRRNILVNPAQPYEEILRLTQGGARVGHVRRVLSHGLRKPLSQRSASPGRNAGDTAVTVLIPTRNPQLLRDCLTALKSRTSGPPFEILVIHHLSDPQTDSAVTAVCQEFGAKRIPYSGPFNFAAMNNLAAREASGDVLLFLNDDVEPREPGWLERMCAALANPGVGVVGARLLYPNGTIQHAGVVVGMGDGAGHPGRFQTGSELWPWLNYTRNVSAVTAACLAIHKRIFEEIGGFDTAFPNNYNDVDLCLRVGQAGHHIVLQNSAILTHKEAATRQGGTALDERVQFRKKWGPRLEEVDPYFTPHLRPNENLSFSE